LIDNLYAKKQNSRFLFISILTPENTQKNQRPENIFEFQTKHSPKSVVLFILYIYIMFFQFSNNLS
jgi:hypothetical protein